MKKLFRTITLALLTATITNAQVKLPKIDTRTGELITQKQ